MSKVTIASDVIKTLIITISILGVRAQTVQNIDRKLYYYYCSCTNENDKNVSLAQQQIER